MKIHKRHVDDLAERYFGQKVHDEWTNAQLEYFYYIDHMIVYERKNNKAEKEYFCLKGGHGLYRLL